MASDSSAELGFQEQNSALIPGADRQIVNPKYNRAPFPKKLSFAANRTEINIAERFSHASVQKSVAVELALIDALDRQINDLIAYLVRTAKVTTCKPFTAAQHPGRW